MTTLNLINRFQFSIVIAAILAITFSCSDNESANLDSSTQNSDVILVEDVFENIRVLNGMPVTHLNPVMNFFWNSLQVHCIECHVLGENGWDFPNDEKESKQTARRMIMMVQNINKNNFNGESMVTCFTCHRGSLEPVEFMYFPQNPPSYSQYNKRVEKQLEKQLPSTRSVLDKHHSIVSNKKYENGIELVILEGIFRDASGWQEVKYKIKFNSAGNYLFVSEVLGDEPDTTTVGSDGDSTWVKTGPNTAKAIVVDVYRFDSFIRLLDFDAAWSQLEGDEVVRTELINSEEVSIVKRRIDDSNWEEFYISSESGYLLKKIIYTNTPVAVLTMEVSFSDFRMVDDIAIAHEIKLETGNLFRSGVFKIESFMFGDNSDNSTFSPDS